jgi:GNAT superfamily N-acetyltransferase
LPKSPAVEIHPLTSDRWDDLVDLFGPKVGANSGCWCMWWRMGSADWKAVPREEKRDRFRAMVKDGPSPGILAYDGDQAVGWCAVGPRATLPRMQTSRVAKPLDATEEAWAVNCFFVRSGWRGKKMMRTLLDGALDFAARQGARIVEACPLDTERKLFWGEGFVGIGSVFRRAGFKEIARRTPTRPLMRLELRRKGRG